MFCLLVSRRGTHKSPKIVCWLADTVRGVFQTWKDTESDANIRLVRNAAFLNRIFICIPSEIERCNLFIYYLSLKGHSVPIATVPF